MRKKQSISISIDYRSHESYDKQIVNQIKTLIFTHRFEPKMADASYLSQLLSLNETIIILAFDQLIKEQIYDRDSKGNYFANYQEATTLEDQTVFSIVDIIKSLDQSLLIKSFDIKEMVCDHTLSEKTGYQVGEHIYFQKRIYYGNNYPKSYMELYFSKKMVPNISDSNYSNMPYFEILSNAINETPKVSRTLAAIKLSDDVNKHLNQEKKSNGFYSKEHHYNRQGDLLLYGDLYFNLNYFVRLKGQKDNFKKL